MRGREAGSSENIIPHITRHTPYLPQIRYRPIPQLHQPLRRLPPHPPDARELPYQGGFRLPQQAVQLFQPSSLEDLIQAGDGAIAEKPGKFSVFLSELFDGGDFDGVGGEDGDDFAVGDLRGWGRGGWG